MENLQRELYLMLQELLPEPLLNDLSNKYAENVQNAFQNPIFSYIKDSTQSNLATQFSTLRKDIIDPYLLTPLSTLLVSTTGTNDLFSVLILLGILYVSFRLLDYARRVIMWWVFLIIRVTFWGTLALLALYVWRVGFVVAAQDFGWAWGMVEGFVLDFQARASAAAAAAAAAHPGHGHTDSPYQAWEAKKAKAGGWF